MEQLRRNLADQEVAHATLESILLKATEVWQDRAKTLHELTIHELEKYAVILEEKAAEGVVTKGGAKANLTLLALKALDHHYETLVATPSTATLLKFAYKTNDIGLLQLLKEFSDEELSEIKLDIYDAAESGKGEIVRMLLDDPDLCDVNTNYSGALRLAAARGHADIVKMLLEDGRADPTICNSDALSWAAIYGHQHVIDLLLADGRVDPNALQNFTRRSNL